ILGSGRTRALAGRDWLPIRRQAGRPALRMVDKQRVEAELEELGRISSEAWPVVTRVVFSEADLRGREFVKGLCRAAGLAIREDAVGNTFARWAGSEDQLPAVATGSHIDAIPN